MRKRRLFVGILALFIIVLIAARLYLPTWLTQYVNRTLDRIPGYHGAIDDVDVHLWRGAYSIINLRLLKTGGKVPVPFFSAKTVDLSVQWKELFHGALVGEIEVERPKLNFVNAEARKNAQTGIHPSWQKAAKDLFPLKINRFQGTNGEVHFRDFERKPQVDVSVNEVFIEAQNLTNSEKISKDLNATIYAEGKAEKEAPITVHVKLNPLQETPAFTLDASLNKLQLVRLNDFFKSYAFFDVQGGLFELYTELQSDGKDFHGYVKPFFKDIDVLSLEHDINNPLQLIWESVVGFFAELLENSEKDQIATRIPISGRYKDPQTDTWEAIGGLLSNAFIEALKPGIEGGRKR